MTTYNEQEAIDYNDRRPYSKDQWKTIQSILGTTVDGDPGKLTARAARDWQANNGLLADGKVGDTTLAAINAASPQEPSSGHEPPGSTRNRDTRRIQGDETRDIMIDVSFYQGDIDWPTLATWSQVKGVIVKATQSREKRGGMRPFMDSKYLQNVKGARSTDTPWGSYHLVVATLGDGTLIDPGVDAAYAVSATEGNVGPLGLWVDWETTWVEDLIDATGSQKAAADWMQTHLEEIEHMSGQRPGLYWSHRGVKALGEEAERFRNTYRHWWAYYYSDSKPLPALSSHPGKPEGWPWTLWQFTSSALCVGIKDGNSSVDCIVCAPGAFEPEGGC